MNEPLDFELKGLQPEHPYLLDRGFSPETIRHFGLGYCARGLMTGRVAIPLQDSDDRLVGYAGRITDDRAISDTTPKYKLPPKRERNGVVYEFHKSGLVYNANRIQGIVDRLIVVEGFPSVWWLHQAGITDVVALMGSSCSPEQAAIILAKTSDHAGVVVFPDGDDAGDRFAQSVFATLGPYRWMCVHPLERGRQPTDCAPHMLTSFFGA